MTRIRRMIAGALALMFVACLSAGAAFAAGKPLPAGKVNVNTASVEQLSTLPGVGPKLAARILEYRQKSGGFKTAQELLNVRGIGEKNLQKLQAYVTTGEAPRSAAAR